MTKAAILTVLRRLSWIEAYMPARKSLELRYILQKHLGFLEPEFNLLPLLVSRGKIAIDAGANTGLYSYHLSGLASEIYAFEPIKRLAERLDAARLANVWLENVALSNESGVSTLKIPVMRGVARHTRASLNAGSESAIEQDVVLKPLDDYRLDNVGFIKIDVEGHEYPLLKGAEKTILKNQPNILIEIESQRLIGRSMEDVFGLFSEWNYQGYFYWRGGKMAVRDFDVSIHQERCDNLYKNPDYVNNFVFLPKGATLELPLVI